MKHLSSWVFGVSALALLPCAALAETREYNLTIDRQDVRITGQPLKKITLNGSIPGPVLRFKEGDEAVIHVTNKLREDTSIHWHGLILPGNMDGIPGFNGFKAIRPGQTFTYRFPIKQSGTYWYHSHTTTQEQDGLYAGLVIEPAIADPVKADRDYVVLLSDFSKEDADDILKNLKKSSDYYQTHRRTVGDFFRDVGNKGFGKAVKDAAGWGKMRMLPTDLADVNGYHFLVNGLSNDQNWTGVFKPGERVRLRFINASAMTIFDVRIPGLKMTVVAADGQPVEPVEVDELRFGNAETYDVIVEPTDDKAYTIAAESIDREGFALGTLAPREGMKGAIPAARPRALLTMADMNMEAMMRDDPDMDMSDMETESGWAKSFAPEGTKILSYADLRYLNSQSDTREPTRDITVRLGGNMERYIWTMNGTVFDPMNGIKIGYNERVRISYVNETMMAHPIHLHGMFTQVENGQDSGKMPNKHTIIVPPGQTESVILTANEPGEWPIHCHLLYHMAAGMMAKVIVAQPGEVVDLPPSDPAPAAMDHSAHGAMSGMDHSAHDMKNTPAPDPAPGDPHAGHDMSNMDHSQHSEQQSPAPADHQNHGEVTAGSTPRADDRSSHGATPAQAKATDHSAHDATAPTRQKTTATKAKSKPAPKKAAPAKTKPKPNTAATQGGHHDQH
jgi:FtsP/CotA-like multicopper oxidase with cupredoxin domain